MTALRQLAPALRIWAVLTVALGLVYPLALVGIGRLMPGRADGSLVAVDGSVVGSTLVAQPFAADQRTGGVLCGVENASEQGERVHAGSVRPGARRNRS